VSRGTKGVVLIALLAGIAASVWTEARGSESAWFVSQSLIGTRGLREGAIDDAVHDWTAPLHGRLVQNPGAANVLLITSSGFIDLFGLFLLGSALFGPSLRPGIGLLLLFVFRQVSQLTCALPTPPGMIWRYPGFPSLLVTYSVANDFFFSGHTAIAVLGAIEVAKIAPWWIAVVAAIIAFLEAATVLVLRAHYTMDVLAAFFAAFCAGSLAARLSVGF
jgi:hypothetical protein